MTIYILQHTESGTLLAYTQIGAFLLDPANPITVQPRQWSNLCKEGYPVRYKEWRA
jgi:hypothetical protein